MVKLLELDDRAFVEEMLARWEADGRPRDPSAERRVLAAVSEVKAPKRRGPPRRRP